MSNILKTIRNAWSRSFRVKKNQSVIVWPPFLTLICVVAFGLIIVGAQFDAQVYLEVRSSTSPVIRFLRQTTDVVQSHLYLIPALTIMIGIAVIDWSQCRLGKIMLLFRSFERASFVFVAIAAPGIAVDIVKQFIGRGRPNNFNQFGPFVFSPFEFTASFQGFPSGHSATAGSLAMVIALFYPLLRWPALLLMFILAAARIAANAHYLSDVIAGYAIGTICTLVLARWLASRAVMFRVDSNAVFPVLRT